MTSNSTDEDSYDSSSSENEYNAIKKEYRKCKFCGKFFFVCYKSLIFLRIHFLHSCE